jgi:hypothetical protein
VSRCCLRSKIPGWLRISLIILIPAAFAVLTLTNYRYVLDSPGGNEFLPRWMGAQAWLKDNVSPYDPSVSAESQQIIYGRPAMIELGEDPARFLYPLPVMAVIAPFGMLPYEVSRTIWMTLIELGLPLLALISIRTSRWRASTAMLSLAMLFSLAWYHGFRSVILGDFSVFEALFIAGALLAVQRKQDILAGILLTLSLSNPQLSFLLILFILFWAISNRRWALIASFLGFSIVLTVIFTILLPDWPLRWIQQILEFGTYHATDPPAAIISRIFPPIANWVWLSITVLSLVYLLWEWFMALRKDENWFQWTAAMTLVITNLLIYRTTSTSYLVLIPGLFIIFSIWNRRWHRRGELGIIIVLVGLFLGLWSLFLLRLEGSQESALMFIPFPLIVLLGLWWVRWWAIRSSKLMFEKDSFGSIEY